MSRITLLAQPAEMTMTTIQLVGATCYEHSNSWQMAPTTERKPRVHMSWVVVTDENGKRQLRMRWTAVQCKR
jgi:hypothetical protein